MAAEAAVWTGNAGNGSMSDGGNWEGGSAPAAGDALDFSAVTVATTLSADFGDSRGFGAVTMGISGDASAKKVPYALTTCGGFGSATVTLAAGSPDWAKLSVDGNGNLVLERKKTCLVLIVR